MHVCFLVCVCVCCILDELATVPGDSTSAAPREKPLPPPKPVTKTYKYESLKDFLVKEGHDPSICMHLELGATTCQGNLYKLGGASLLCCYLLVCLSVFMLGTFLFLAVRKNWLQRWFVLDFNCQYFAYFENQQVRHYYMLYWYQTNLRYHEHASHSTSNLVQDITTTRVQMLFSALCISMGQHLNCSYC